MVAIESILLMLFKGCSSNKQIFTATCQFALCMPIASGCGRVDCMTEQSITLGTLSKETAPTQVRLILVACQHTRQEELLSAHDQIPLAHPFFCQDHELNSLMHDAHYITFCLP